jgi:hypothetical protein
VGTRERIVDSTMTTAVVIVETTKTNRIQVSFEKARRAIGGFLVVRPAGRVHLEVKVLYEPGRGNR